MSSSIKDRFIPVAKNYLNGESSIQRHKNKTYKVCKWILFHGIVSAEVIKMVAQQKNNSLPKQMVIEGLLFETKTTSGTPKFFYTLTRTGMDFATSFSRDYVDYNKYLSPLKLSQANFQHDLQIQKLSLMAIRKFGIKYLSQSQMMIRQTRGVKVPDGLWLDNSNKKIAIEVEYSQKFGRVLDMTISSILESLREGRYDYYFYFVRSQIIQTNYSEAMKGGKVISKHVKNDKNIWIKDMKNIEIVPDWLSEKVFFLMEDKWLDEFPVFEID